MNVKARQALHVPLVMNDEGPESKGFRLLEKKLQLGGMHGLYSEAFKWLVYSMLDVEKVCIHGEERKEGRKERRLLEETSDM